MHPKVHEHGPGFQPADSLADRIPGAMPQPRMGRAVGAFGLALIWGYGFLAGKANRRRTLLRRGEDQISRRGDLTNRLVSCGSANRPVVGGSWVM